MQTTTCEESRIGARTGQRVHGAEFAVLAMVLVRLEIQRIGRME